MDLDLRQLMRIAGRWWWLVVLGGLFAGLTAYFVVSRQQPMYEASATLLINSNSTSSNTFGAADPNSVTSSRILAETYVNLVTVDEVITATESDLGASPGQLGATVSAHTEANSQLLVITTSSTDPQRAADVANAVAMNFSEYIAEQRVRLTGVSRQALEQQIANIQTQLDATQQQQQNLQSGADAGSPATQSQLASLQATYNLLQQSQSELILRLQELDLQEATARATVTLVDPAQAPENPYAPNIRTQTLLAVFAGIMIAVGAIALLEYLDNTVKPSVNFERTYGAPMLSVLTRATNLKTPHDQVFVLNEPHSSLAESVRLLRTNLEFAAATADIQSLSVTSSSPGDGKSTVAANLAVSMAQSGFVTILVDADLRRPTQHKVFELRNDRGLTNLLTNPALEWKDTANQVGHPNLWVLTSGPVPPNPADLLSSNRLPALVKHLEQEADVVVFDTPPILAVSDPLIVATQVDGVLLVASSGTTRIDALQRALDALPDESVRTLGIVLNKHVARSSGDYYYAYSYYGPGDKPPAPSPAPSSERSASLSS